MEFKLLRTIGEYKYWVGHFQEQKVYNITPKTANKPTGGYYSKEYICKIKNVPITHFD